MGCGCNNRIDPEVALRLQLEQSMCEPTGWGPILWRYLHSLAEQLGYQNNSVESKEEAEHIFSVLKLLPLILPCRECQKHTAEYMLSHPLHPLKELRGSYLRNTTREWLFLFHNAVREKNNSPLMIATVEECQAMYANSSITRAQYNQFVQCVISASRNGWVKLENWRKWYAASEQLLQKFQHIIV